MQRLIANKNTAPSPPTHPHPPTPQPHHPKIENQYQAAPVPSARPTDTPPLPGVIDATAPCPNLLHTRTTRVGPGAVTYINDRGGLHSVRCPDDCPTEEGGITLHIYAPPIRRWALFGVWLGAIAVRALCLSSPEVVLPGVDSTNQTTNQHTNKQPTGQPTDPTARVKLYEPENDRIVQRTPGFFTVRGRKTES
jgi:hypothetical protein